ncbi:MAG: anti-sigma factor [Haliscomenobacter sp.]|uniref:anti-sigma factor n=1 Tax=Haliscomenobacter sp. TaxID=2717303 RepID=UPI0029A8B779|nr:anti-sigma factor [Haliscomenobacter sp.]MDX2069621.1 anti-sigma factor [Haliscomenobacter sp.]
MEKFNIQEYLDSGVIEMYVLDQLSDAEREEVEKLAAQYPEIREEIAEVEEAMGTYHTLEGLTPPDHILSNIMAATAPGEVATAPITVTTLPKRTLSILWPMAAAVVGLALAAWMYIGKQSVQQELATLKKTTEDLRSNQQALGNKLQAAQKALDELDDVCCAEKLTVNAADQPIAAVYWDKKVRLAHLKLLKLANPGKNKQYQLWAFVKGKPVSVGVVDWEALQKGLITFEFQNKPEAFAISLEPYGGSLSPTDVKGASGKVVNQG